ncbi:MAG: GIY-YIG nuclease family protein [Syntrophobacterales bacterium]|nr:MAG: GIY-YIG nuclease family protein [Syntrophobacterales bacterium]
MENWYVYMIRCGGGSLYTGITTDVDRRFSEHQSSGPRAARYLKGRGPLQLVLTVHARDRGAALRLEHRIKRLPRAQKETLIQHPESLREIAGVVLT